MKKIIAMREQVTLRELISRCCDDKLTGREELKDPSFKLNTIKRPRITYTAPPAGTVIHTEWPLQRDPATEFVMTRKSFGNISDNILLQALATLPIDIRSRL